MITNWATVPPELLTARFDAWVARLFDIIRIYGLPKDTEVIERAIELRTDVLDLQLEHIQAARN